MGKDEQSIRDVVARWHRATAEGDVETVLGLMAEDAVFLASGRPPMRGRAAFEKGLRQLLKEHRIQSTGEVQEVGISGDLAYCWTALEVNVTPLSGGDTVRRTGSTLSVFQRQPDGSWVLTRDANLLAAAS
jgi:uncharacterized protein (TIGR02246 family)